MWSRVVLGLVLSITALMPACSDGSARKGVATGNVETTDATTRASETGDIGSGVEITVAGRVTRIVDGHLFLIGADGAEPVVVLVPRVGSGVRTGATVEATGALRRLAIAAVEAEFGIDLDDRRASDFEGRPALVATRLRTEG